MNAREALTTKLGPLPAWAWGVIAGGGYLAWTRLRPEPITATDEGANPDAGTPTPGSSGPDPFNMGDEPVSFFPPAPSPDPTPDPEPEPEPEDNNAWSRAVVRWLIEVRRFDSITASNAVSKFLDGDELTAGEADVIRAALREFGPPPQGAPTIRVARPAPAPPRPPAPPPPGQPRPPAGQPRPPAVRSPAIPNTPGNVEATVQPRLGRVVITWRHRAPTGTRTGYEVTVDGGRTHRLPASATRFVHDYRDRGPRVGTTVRYLVRTVNGTGRSQAVAVSVRIPQPTTPRR